MIKKIDSIPQEIEDKFPDYVDKWLKVAFNTGPIDGDKAFELIQTIYKNAGATPPARYDIFDSPKQCLDSIKNPECSNFVYGNHSAYLYSMYEVMMDIGVQNIEIIKPYMELSKVCGWWYPLKDVVYLIRNPVEIHMEDEVLHNEDGPSILYADGFSVYSYRGSRIPKNFIEEKDKITLDRIKEEENVEHRRILRELYGEGKYLTEIGAKVLDMDVEGARKGAAPRALLEDNEGRVFLVGTDGSTGRTYYMEVDSECKTCKEAHEGLSGFSEDKILAKS